MARTRESSFRYKYLLPARQFALRWITTILWTLSPRLSLWIIKHLFLVPPRQPLTVQQKELLSRGRRFNIRVLNRDLACWQWGEGPVVVMVHGWGERAARFHRFVEPLVSGGFSVVAFDLPSHGESQGHYTNFIELVKALKEVLAHTGPPFAVVGYSMGGGAVVSHWELLGANTRQVLISPLYDVFDTLIGFFQRAGIGLKLSGEIFHTLVAEYGINISTINPAENARNVRGDVLVIHDEGDWMVPMTHAEDLVKSMPRARLVRTTGLGHTRMLDSEKVVSEALAFVKESR
jgi:pimeloyl-ACP methyl ester carboxylesterase